MSKARTQPSAKTGLVFKISIILVFLLAIVVYKLNDYFKQEKWVLAQNQLRTQIVSTKTSVSSQLNQLKNILSSYETELTESKINWVQLDPFFGIAKAQKNGSSLSITQYIGRSGSVGERWNAAYLEKALSLRKARSDSPIAVQLFRDKLGSKFLAITFANSKNSSLVVVGSADYFQKYFDLNRGGKMTSLLKTTDNVLAAHSESDYVATLTDEAGLSPKKYLIEKEEIAGTNLIAMNYIAKGGLVSGFVVPLSVVGLITGFGFILIGLLYYGLDPIEKKVERYKAQEREQIFKETVAANVTPSTYGKTKENNVIVVTETVPAPAVLAMAASPNVDVPKTMVPRSMVPRAAADEAGGASEADEFLFGDPVDMSTSFTSVVMPLQQALFNVDSALKRNKVSIEKHINSTLAFDLPFAGLIRAFETVLKSRAHAIRDQLDRRIVVRAYDIEQNITVIEIKDLGFLSTPSSALGKALDQAQELTRQAGGELLIQKTEPQGVLVKMIIKNSAKATPASAEFDAPYDVGENTRPNFNQTDFLKTTQEIELKNLETDDLALIDLEKALSLDDIELEGAEQIQTALTSKNFKTTDNVAPIQKPSFSINKKDFKVDEMAVSIRRPVTNRTKKT